MRIGGGVVLLEVLALLIIQVCCWSSFECGDDWPIQLNDTDQMEELFQNWITVWQNSCIDKQISRDAVPRGGIGASINSAIKSLIDSIERGMIYRPDQSDFLWSSVDPLNCSLRMTSVDCFLKPISHCIDKGSLSLDYDYDLKFDNQFDNQPQFLEQFTKSAIDICGISRKLRKPLQWVHSQFIQYMLRFTGQMRLDIRSRFNQVFPHDATSFDKGIDYNKNDDTRDSRDTRDRGKNSLALSTGRSTGTTIGVHVRYGAKRYLDHDRYRIDLDNYIEGVDYIAGILSYLGRPVSVVFFCGDNPEYSFKSSQYLAEQYPRPFRYVVLPQVSSLEFGDPQQILERDLTSPFASEKHRYDPLRYPLFMEYMADIEILAHADAFLGSVSNLYPLVTGLRLSRRLSHRKQQTLENTLMLNYSASCFLESRHGGQKFWCEGSPEAKEMWRFYYGGYKLDNHFVVP